MRQQKRQHARLEWRRAGKISSLAGHAIINCMIKDVSAGGARLLVPTQEVVPDFFRLDLGEKNTVPKCRVRWRRGNELGVQFYR